MQGKVPPNALLADGPGRGFAPLRGVQVRAPDGRVFALGAGLSDAQRANPPAIGATVTYRYRELTAKGQPRHASFLRVREEP